jgi:hypothetical protein
MSDESWHDTVLAELRAIRRLLEERLPPGQARQMPNNTLQWSGLVPPINRKDDLR